MPFGNISGIFYLNYTALFSKVKASAKLASLIAEDNFLLTGSMRSTRRKLASLIAEDNYLLPGRMRSINLKLASLIVNDNSFNISSSLD